MNNLELKKIKTGIRPPRIITFINQNDPHCFDLCERVIESYSLLWGGGYNLIIPTNGEKIDDIFWEIMEKYKPDYCYLYTKTFNDLFLSDSAKAEEIIKQQTELYIQAYPDSEPIETEGNIRQSYMDSRNEIDNFNLSKKLNDEIIKRLNPFFYDEEEPRIRNFSSLFPPTHRKITIDKVFEQAEELKQVTDLKLDIFEKDFQLLAHSIMGNTRIVKPNLPKSSYAAIAQPPKRLIKIDIKNFDEKNNSQLLQYLYNKSPEDINTFQLGYVGLGKYYFVNLGDVQKQPLIIIAGTSVSDFCLYYNLSKLMDGVYWIPPYICNNIKENPVEDLLSNYAFYIQSDISNRHWPNVDIILSSLSLNQDKLNEIDMALGNANGGEQGFGCKVSIPFKLEGKLLNPYILWEINNNSNTYIEQFLNKNSLNFLKTPKLKFFDNLNPLEHSWITDLWITDLEEESKKNSYCLPARKYFTEDIFINDTPFFNNSEHIRFTGEEISFTCPSSGLIRSDDTMDKHIITPQLHLLSEYEIFERIFDDAGYSIQLSDKGRYSQQSIILFGSLDNLAAELKKDFIQNIFNCYCNLKDNKERKENGIPGTFIRDRVYLQFTDFLKFNDDKKIIKEMVDKFIQNGLLERGFALKCDHCMNSDWYKVNDLSQEFICSRCGSSQIYTSHHYRENEPEIFYKLKEVFYQAYDNNFLVTILSLNKIKNNCEKSFFFIPEIEVRKKSDGKLAKSIIEIDLNCIADGKIITGEDKINSDLPDKLELYKKISNEINSSFIYSTFSEALDGEKIKKIEELDWNNKPTIYTRNDLLS